MQEPGQGLCRLLQPGVCSRRHCSCHDKRKGGSAVSGQAEPGHQPSALLQPALTPLSGGSISIFTTTCLC